MVIMPANNVGMAKNQKLCVIPKPITIAAISIILLRPILSANGARKIAPTVMPTSPELKTTPKFAGEICQS